MHHMQYQYMQNKNDTNVIIVTGKYSNVKIRIKQINCGLKKEFFESEIFFSSMKIVSVEKKNTKNNLKNESITTCVIA